MKTRLIILFLLIVCFECGTNNKPVSDAQKEKIQGEIKGIVDSVNAALEKIDWDAANDITLDSPDFLYTYNGLTDNYEEFMARKTAFETRLNQKCTILNEKYNILDSYTVLYTMNCTWLTNFKDGHSVLHKPSVTQLLFKRIDNRWRVLNIVESGVEQSVRNTETANQHNPVELNNQITGSWKYEYGKDTTGYADFIIYGTGIDAIGKLVSKGKTIRETRHKTFCNFITLNL